MVDETVPRAVTKHGVTLLLNKPPTDEARVAAFEARIGARLPEDYRQFLLEFNGGKPDPSEFDFALRSGPYTDSCVNWFLSLHDGQLSNLELVRDRLAGRSPSELLPIASDPGGNYIMLGISGDARGKVYFWDHEKEPDKQPDWSNIDLVADSFDAFMSGLRASP